MDIKATLASQLYTQAQAVAKPAPQQAPAAAPARRSRPRPPTSWRRCAQSEETVKAGLAGRADPQAVVEALAATELAVQTAVAVRDKVVEAYQEILRMPV